MKRYEFSKHSFVELKRFLDVAENNCSTDNEQAQKWTHLLPINKELINKIKEHTESIIDIDTITVYSSNGETSENKLSESVQEIETNISISKRDNNLDNSDEYMYVLQELLNQQGSDDKMLQILQLLNQEKISATFEALKQHPNAYAIGNLIACCNQSTIQIYCDKILINQMQSDLEATTNLFTSLLESHPQIVYSSLVNFLCSNFDEENAISKDFLENLRHLSEEHKVEILGKLISQLSHLSPIQLAVIDCLLHNKLDLLLIKGILDLLTQNATTVSGTRSFSVLLQNVINNINKNNKGVCVKNVPMLLGLFDNLVNMVHGHHKIKLRKTLEILQLTHADSSFSQTMHL